MTPSKKAFRFFIFLIIFFLVSFGERNARASVILLPSLAVSEEYNDNFLFEGPNREEDLTTTLTPILTLRYANPSVVLSAIYRGGATYHAKHKEENGYVQGVDFDIQLPIFARKFRGIDVRITESSDLSNELPFVPIGGASRDAFGKGLGRVDAFRNKASLAVGYAWSSRHRADFTYLNTLVKYQSVGPEDFISHDTSIRGTYNLSFRSVVNASYGVLFTDFEKSSQFTVQRISLGARYSITPDFFVYADMGGSLLPGDDTTITSEAGIANLFEKPNFKFGYARLVTVGETGSASALLRQTVFMETAYIFSERTSFAARLSNMREDLLLGIADEKTNYHSAVLSGMTRFRPWLSGSANYAYLQRESEGGITSDARSNRVYFLLTLSDPGWKLVD